MTRSRLAPLLLAVGLVAAACGDDSGTGSDGTPASASTVADGSGSSDDGEGAEDGNGAGEPGTDGPGTEDQSATDDADGSTAGETGDSDETDGNEQDEAGGQGGSAVEGLSDDVASHPLAPALVGPLQVEAAGLGGGWTLVGSSITPAVAEPTTEDFCGQPFETESTPEEVQVHLLGADGTSIDHVVVAPGPGVEVEFRRIEALAGCTTGVPVSLEPVAAEVAGAIRTAGVSGDDGTSSILIVGAEFEDGFTLIAVTQASGGSIGVDAVAGLLAEVGTRL